MKNISHHEIHFTRLLWGHIKSSLMPLALVTLALAANNSLVPYALKVLVNQSYASSTSVAGQVVSGAVMFYLISSVFLVLVFRLYNYTWYRSAPDWVKHCNRIAVQFAFWKAADHASSAIPSAQLTNAVRELSAAIPECIRSVYDGIIYGSLSLGIAMCTVSSVSFEFAVGLFVWILLYVLGTIKILHRVQYFTGLLSQVQSRFLSALSVATRQIFRVQCFSGERQEQVRLAGLSEKAMRLFKAKERRVMMSTSFQGVSFVIYQGLCVIWLSRGIKQGIYTSGDLAMILSINTIFVDHFRKISKELVRTFESIGKIRANIQFLNFAKRAATAQKSQPLTEVGFSMRLRGVSFAYSDHPSILRCVDLEINAGDKLIVTGSSGSGKSTLRNLMLGLLTPSQGGVLVNNRCLYENQADCMKSLIAVATHEPHLFLGTIADNIRYGDPTADEDAIIKAAKSALCHDFIMALPQRYDTLIESIGLVLSAGQKQRIALARALLKPSQVLICDEAWCHVDQQIAAKIEYNLLQYSEVAVVMMAHHITALTMRSVDRILTIKNGVLIPMVDDAIVTNVI